MAGVIYNEDAYIQGKMLDHSDWFGKLPRGITPSDIDFLFDNDGHLLFCELSSSKAEWKDLAVGQRWAYENIVRLGVRAMAVLLTHSVPTVRIINSRTDVDSFQIMLAEKGQILTTPIWNGKLWIQFVDKWFRDPQAIRTKCLTLLLAPLPAIGEIPHVGNPCRPTPEELQDSEYTAGYNRPFEPWPDAANRTTPRHLF